MKDLIPIAVRHAPLLTRALIFLVGAVFTATAAVGAWVIAGTGVAAPDLEWRIVLAVVGIPLLAAGAFASLKREQAVTAAADGVLVSHPDPIRVDTVSPPFDVRGSVKSITEGTELWLFAMYGSGVGAKYWPQSVAEVANQTWSCHVKQLSGTPGDQRKFGLFVLGPSAQAMVAYYKFAGIENSKDGEPRWPPILRLPPDAALCTTFEVILGSRRD